MAAPTQTLLSVFSWGGQLNLCQWLLSSTVSTHHTQAPFPSTTSSLEVMLAGCAKQRRDSEGLGLPAASTHAFVCVWDGVLPDGALIQGWDPSSCCCTKNKRVKSPELSNLALSL